MIFTAVRLFILQSSNRRNNISRNFRYLILIYREMRTYTIDTNYSSRCKIGRRKSESI